jgi:hypothetical protein
LVDGPLSNVAILRKTESEIRVRFCPECDLKETCIHEGSDGKLSPLCLDVVATAILCADFESSI